MNSKTYVNRNGVTFEFILDEKHDIIWKGDFQWCRFSLFKDTKNYVFIDPVGGPFIDINSNLGWIGFTLDYIVESFEKIPDGYKIITHKCPKCYLPGGIHKIGCETRKVTVNWNDVEEVLKNINLKNDENG